MYLILTPTPMYSHPNSQLQPGLVFHSLVTMTKKEAKAGRIYFGPQSQRVPYMAGW